MLETHAQDTPPRVSSRSRAARNPVRSDNELLVWPVVAGLLAMCYSLTLANSNVPIGSLFLEGALLVQTVVLTVAVALVAIVAQNSSTEIRLLMRIGVGGVQLLFAEFIAGIVVSVVGIIVVLTNISSIEPLTSPVVVGVTALLFVSIALLVVSFLVLLRQVTPERLVRALVAAAEDVAGRSDRLESCMAEIEAYGGRLVDESDLNAFRELSRGVADLQMGVESAHVGANRGQESTEIDLVAALASVQIRLLIRAQGHSLFGQAVVRELYRGSVASRTRMKEILLRVTSAPVLDRDLVVEVLQLGSHLGPNRQFWKVGLKALLSPAEVAIWDDRFVQPFIEQVAKRRISGTELHNLIKFVVTLSSVTPDRLASFLNSVDVNISSLRDEAEAGAAGSRAIELLQEQVCMLRPRVLRSLLEEEAAGDLRQSAKMLIRKTWDVSGAIGRYWPHANLVAENCERELKALDGDAKAVFALIVLSRIGSQNYASESREAIERQLSESFDSGDVMVMARLMQEQFDLAGSSAGEMGSALSQRLWQTRLAGISAGVHVLWACKALGRRSSEVAPGSLGYVKEATNDLSNSVSNIDETKKVYTELVDRSLTSLAARLLQAERMSSLERRTALEVLAAAMILAVYNHAAGISDDLQRKSIARSMDTIAASLDVFESRADWILVEGTFSGVHHILDLHGLEGTRRQDSPAVIARSIQSLYASESATS